jgi:hypothetical protein
MDPRALPMLGKCSTTEYPVPAELHLLHKMPLLQGHFFITSCVTGMIPKLKVTTKQNKM